jgi:beta-glucosidase
MLSSILKLAALVGTASAVVQPLNTTILGQYGHSPPVYPSREHISDFISQGTASG